MGWNYLSISKLQRLHCWSLGMDKLFHPTVYNGCNYLSMLGLKLNQVSKRGPWCQWPLQHGSIWHDIACSTAVTETNHKPEFKLIIGTSYLYFTRKLWGVYCKDFRENWLCYDNTALYMWIVLYACNFSNWNVHVSPCLHVITHA